MKIGPYVIDPPLVLAPMAGVTDRPFRVLCRRLGAGLAVSEMTSSDPRMWATSKSRTRMDHTDEPGPVSVQIAGGDPESLAAAARFNVERGAQIIDINMGCPAKKVCRADAGSALMRDEGLVARICAAVVEAVDVPVTLKIRTGWSRELRNGIRVARIAEDSGIRALAVHGRTREDHFSGDAEHATVAEIKQSVRIPVLANGDIRTPQAAAAVLRSTGVDGLMIGRAAQGRPWLFSQIGHYLRCGELLPEPDRAWIGRLLLEHLAELHALYGDSMGVRVARKHIQWYCQQHPGGDAFWREIREVDAPVAQRRAVAAFFGIAERVGTWEAAVA